MMLKYSLNQDQAAEEVEDAVKTVLEKGYRTSDIYEEGTKKVGCKQMGALIVGEIKKPSTS